MSGGRRGELAESDDGAAAAAPLGVVRHVHPVVGAVDVVDAGLALVPVLHFREGDQLDGLALRKQLAGESLSVLPLPAGSCRELPATWGLQCLLWSRHFGGNLPF